MVNERKEFFRVSLSEVEKAVLDHHGKFEITKVAEAKDYRQTLARLEEQLNHTALTLQQNSSNGSGQLAD